MSKFAVIIPLYRHARYIRETLASVLAQTELPRRILVLDDGSPDDSLAVARAVAAEHPLVEVHAQENQGAHNTLNRLVEMASDFEYVAILNSDDRFHPRRLELGGAFLDAHRDAELLCTGLQIIGTNGDPLPEHHPRTKWFRAAWSCQGAWERGELSLSAWLGRANFLATTSNFMVRRAYLKNRPFGDYRFAHDYSLLAQAALDRHLALLPEPLLDYRVHENNTITTEPVRLTTEMLRVALDLAALTAPRLPESADLRAEWAAFLSAIPESISALRWDCFSAALTLPPGDSLDFPELTEFANKHLVNSWDGQGDLWANGGSAELGRAYEQNRLKHNELKATDRARADLSRLQEAILASRWATLGIALRQAEALRDASRGTAQEKLARLKKDVANNPWLRLGKGFKGVRKIYERATE
jgi:hypothetical protein